MIAAASSRPVILAKAVGKSPLYVVNQYHICGNLYRMLDLRSKARQRLLAYYFTNATARHHLRDLAVRLRIEPF